MLVENLPAGYTDGILYASRKRRPMRITLTYDEKLVLHAFAGLPNGTELFPGTSDNEAADEAQDTAYHELRRQGLLQQRVETFRQAQKRGGDPANRRHYYRVTDKGWRVIECLREEWDD